MEAFTRVLAGLYIVVTRWCVLYSGIGNNDVEDKNGILETNRW